MQGGGDAQGPDSANVDLPQLLVEVEAVDGLVRLVEVSRVVDHDVQGLREGRRAQRAGQSGDDQ